jgi:Bacterial Ig-like domain
VTWADNSSKSLSHAGNRADVRFISVAAEVAGPSVIAATPISDTFGDVSSVRIAFDEEIQVPTFTPDQIVSFTGPDGEIPVTGIAVVPNTGNTQFDISFANQHRLGNYTMAIGPNILDEAGKPMDQSDNGIPGETPADEYIAKFTIQGPKIIASTPAGKLFGPVSSIQVTFNEPVDPVTFTSNSIFAFKGPQGFINITTITPVAGSNNTQFDVGFLPQGTAGVYTMLIGPGIQDLAGHQMDQDGNFIEGEFPGDAYAAQFAIRGPTILSAKANTTTGPVFSLRVTFDEPMDLTSFTPDSIASFTGPNGPISVLGVVAVPDSKLTQFDIVFAPQTTTGHYTMVIGPNIRDFFGNPMDQDGNLITGEIPDDQFTALFTVSGPRIIASTPPALAIGSVDHVRVTFSEPMDVSTFTPDKIVSFTGPQGLIPVTNVSVVPFTGNTQFDISFALSSVLGSYTMVIGPDIRDIYGNQMDQDNNFIPGEMPDDQFTAQFALFSVNLIQNGDFEANGGSFDGWTTLSQAGSSGGWYIQTGTTSPLSGFPVPEPPGPTHAAMTDMLFQGSHVLFQDFTVPMGITAAILSFDRFIGNRAAQFATPGNLDFTGNFPNQQARVDILTTTADPFSVATGNILLKVFQTAVGDPLISGYTTQTSDLTAFLAAHEGQTLRLRFALVDNQFFFQFGVDRVILALATGGAGGAAPFRPRGASASAVGGQAAVLLGTKDTGDGRGLFAMPLPSEPLIPLRGVPLLPTGAVPAQRITYIDRFFASTGMEDKDPIFALYRPERTRLALAGLWQDEAVTAAFQNNAN